MSLQRNLSLTFTPANAAIYGIEGAVLLELLQQQAVITGAVDVVIRLSALQQRCSFWTESDIARIVQMLAERGVAVSLSGDAITFKVSEAKNRQETHSIPVVDPQRAAQNRAPTQTTQSVQPVVPAERVSVPSNRRSAPPSFGGGWRRSANELDEIFAAAEAKKRLQIRMAADWRPSTIFYEKLSTHGIEPAFADGCLDEFTLYYLDQLDSETTWNQKLLAWVKRALRDEQSRNARDGRANETIQTGGQNEKGRRDTRENRKRVTAAVMDLKNLDW